jgi:hypothetical protein
MSFLDRAKQAAAQAAEGAKAAADQARQTVSDPATAEKAKMALSRAKRGVSTAIDRIDPSVLADVIIKATALQEKANSGLKAKGSPYRISEVSIGAAIPPSVTFAISRIDDPAEDLIPEGAVASTALLAEVTAATDGSVQALDGSTVDDSAPVADGS